MKTLKTALFAVLALFSLQAAVSARELNSLSAADVREMTADVQAPAPKLAFADALMPKSGKDPVVITVPGLKFGEIGWGSLEIRNILRVFEFFFRNKEITEADIVSGIVGFSPRYFFPDPDAVAPVRDVRLEDNYLEQKLKEIPGYENHDVIVIPFAWSRDPGDSKAVIPQLQARITEVCDAYKASGRPVYILAHSWGSMLAHTALHRAAAARPDLRVDKLITAGSPLVPGNAVVKMFVNLETKKEGLEKVVRKPAIVRVWRNFWAARDAYSNAIPAADSNYMADETVENVEPTLIDIILHKKPLRKEARKDLFKIRDIKAWHSAYFFDYQASLKSIEKEISVEVFRPALAPQVVDCSKAPAAPMCKP